METGGVHHLALRVQDPEASRRFYEDVVGLRFMELPVSREFTRVWRGAPDGGALLAAPIGSTFLVIEPPLEGTPADERFSEHRIGLDHLAFAVAARDELEALAKRLEAAGVETQGIETDPVLGKEYVCFRDPDNVQCEAYMV